MERVEVLLYVFDDCVAGIINYQDVIHVSNPPPTHSVIVWFTFMYFILLPVSVLSHSVLPDPCFDSVCQAMRM